MVDEIFARTSRYTKIPSTNIKISFKLFFTILIFLLVYKTRELLLTDSTTNLAIDFMESWFCIWDDLVNPKTGLNLVPNLMLC